MCKFSFETKFEFFELSFVTVMFLVLAACIPVGSTYASEVSSGYEKASDVIETTSYGAVEGSVAGLESGDIAQAKVVLYNASNSMVAIPTEAGFFSFPEVLTGKYYLKIEANGYTVSTPASVQVEGDATASVNLVVNKVAGSNYFYNWKADETYFGYEETAQIAKQPEVTFLDKKIYISNTAASVNLMSDYQVYLVDGDVAWSSDYASRLYDLFSDVSKGWTKRPSKWMITNEHIANDVEIVYSDALGDTVRVSVDAFKNAVPRLAQMDGIYGSYFSNKLFDVVVRYVTKNGYDACTVDNILKENFGCSITVDDYESLTRDTTGETAAAFEAFKPEELISIISMFQEMPEGFHKIDGLKYLVRRVDGSVNPVYPEAAAVSWVYAPQGYIEFVDKAFLGDAVNDTFRLILHEKTHFLWKNLFSKNTKQEWIRIGGWHEDATTSSGWSTDKMTEFVSAYSHDINPDEDMAESVAFYILNPSKLQANAPEKYEFIKNCIMHGETYKAQIREDLTFEVYNLYPDYAYPGRIVGLSVDVQGGPEEDKTVTVTIDLDTHGDARFGGTGGYMRIASTKSEQFYDSFLTPTKDDGSQLQASFNINKHSAADYWKCVSLSVSDNAGNTRYMNDNNFGWQLDLDNPLEDLEAPKFVEDSINVSLEPEDAGDGHTVTHVVITFYATDNDELSGSGAYCEIANNMHDTYRLDKRGTIDAKTGLCTVVYDFSEYYPSGEYSINCIRISDAATNQGIFNFFSDGTGTKSYTTFNFESEKSDLVGPELDVNGISISAAPTNPEHPNGETVVKLGFWIKDDIAGFDYGSFNLLDPQGNVHMEYFYSDNYYKPYFIGDPTVWKYYEKTIVLPVGSAPGIWGLQGVRLYDKAANFTNYNFEEIIHFKAADASQLAEWGIICDQSEFKVGDVLNLKVDGNTEGKTVMWECTNGTGRAAVDSRGELTLMSKGTVTVFAYDKNNMDTYGSLEINIAAANPCRDGHDEADDAEVAATCTQPGLTAGKHCARCGEVLVAQEETPALGHIWSDWKILKDASETDAGLEARYCEVCELEETREIPIIVPECFDLSEALIALSDTEYEYNGRECTPNVSVMLRNKILVINQDFTVSYKDNLLPGEASVVIEGAGKYSGKVTLHYSIVRSLGNELALPGIWKHDSVGWWYLSDNGTYPSSCCLIISGNRYSFDSSGYMETGWIFDSNAWRYFGSDGAMQSGWKYVSNSWYWLDDSGAMATGWHYVNGAWYLFDDSGSMRTGWNLVGGAWYWLDDSGAMATDSWVDGCYVGGDGKWAA